MGRFTGTLAIEGFDGADVADIDTSAPDGGGDLAKAIGLWAKHPVFTSGELARLGNVGVNLTDYASYNLTAIPDLPDSYGSRLRQTLPSSDSATPPTGQYMESWTYYAYATGDNLAHGPWTGNVSDLVGGATIGGVLQINDLTIHPNGQPAFVDIEVIGGDPSGGDLAHILFRSFASDLEGATPHVFQLDVDWDITEDPITYLVPDGPIGIPVQICRLRIGATVAATAVTPAPTPADPTPPGSGWTNLTGSDHTSQDVGTNSASTGVTIQLDLEATGGRYEWTFSELATDDGTFELVDPGSGGDEFVLLEVAVNKHDTDPVMYQLQGTFAHPIAGIPAITFELWEYFSGGAGSRKLRPTYGPVFWSHDRAPDIQLDWDNDTKTLHGYLSDGVTDDEIFTFHVGVDTPQTGVAGDVADLDGVGSPGLSGLDLNFAVFAAPLSWQLDQYAVCVLACEGPPENPYPRDPPPVDPPPTYLYRSTGLGSWDAILVPDGVLPRAGTEHVVISDLRVRDRAAWVELGPSLVQAPPPDTPDPPFYDPCETLDPGVDLPPVGDVTPIPSVAGRSFGMGPMPVTLFGDVLNAAQRPIGGWTAAELAIALARGAVIFGGTGGYAQFQSGGFYRPTLMDAWIQRIATTYGALLLAGQANGSFGGMTTLDDFRWNPAWPTSLATGGGTGRGLSAAEVERIIARWHYYLPTLRVGLRIAPTRAERHYAGCSYYCAQYDGPSVSLGKRVTSTLMLTAADFRFYRDRELARAASFDVGPGITVVCNLQPNFLHGGSIAGYDIGDQWPQPYITPSELLVITEGWYGDGGGPYVDRIYSSHGFQYTKEYVALTGMWDALADMHNGVMSLPPL